MSTTLTTAPSPSPAAAEESEAPSFEPGDRVRVLETHQLNRTIWGLETEVVKVGPDVVSIRLKDDRLWAIKPSELELIATARERQWQIGDYVEGTDPHGNPLSGAITAIGEKWLRIGSSPKEAVAANTARLLEPAGAAPAPASIETITAELVPDQPADRLAQLEDDVQQGLELIEKGKARIWAAAAAIRSEELWRLGGHESFETYCRERWGWGKSNANENALAGEVLRSLTGIPLDALPTSTSAMAELNKVEPERRPEVLKQAAEANGGKATAKAIKQVAAPVVEPEEEPVYTDCNGTPIAIGDTVLSTATHRLMGTVESFEPENFLPVTIRTHSGGQTKARPQSLIVIDLEPEQPASPAETAQPATSEAPADQSGVETPAPVTDDSARRYRVKAVVVDKYRPYSPLVIVGTSDTQARCWDFLEEHWIGWSQLEPWDGPPEAISYEAVLRRRLKDLVKVGGRDAIAQLLEEV